MMVFDCTAIPEGLMESEMFGHVKGSFTSAVADRNGMFQLANGGSLLLDEIGELGLPLQAKLLRVIQSREFRMVGGKEPIKVDVRIIAATNKDLAEMAGAGTFREDLFYRLDVLSIRVPSLRERKEDIPLLVDHFIQNCNRRSQTQICAVHPKTMGAFLRYHWPGNVRELENCIERAAVMADGPMLTVDNLDSILKPTRLTEQVTAGFDETSWPLNLKEAERILMLRALRSTGGDKTRAAELLGISLRTLYYKLKGLDGAEIPTAKRIASDQAEFSTMSHVR
jgi:transcriptional regulator with PAS, ATPase and Fis domain